jgi:hypothetical protein
MRHIVAAARPSMSVVTLAGIHRRRPATAMVVDRQCGPSMRSTNAQLELDRNKLASAVRLTGPNKAAVAAPLDA